MNMQLISKADYLAWKKTWKEEYAFLSNLIRAEKQAIVLMNRGGYSAARTLQSQLVSDRLEARERMEEHGSMKKLASFSKWVAKWVADQVELDTNNRRYR